MRFHPLLTLALLAAPLAAQTAPAKRPMTFADLQAMKRVSDPQISPSGKWVLFSATDVSLEKNTKTNHLWVVPLDGSQKERQLTNGSGESNGRFSPDGKWVLYSADDAGKGQIFLAAFNDANGSLATGNAVTHLETEADGAIWSPDGKSIAFTSEVYSDCSGITLDEACNKSELDEDAHSATKALVFDSLLYRHWNQYQAPLAKPDLPKGDGYRVLIARHSHILMLHLAEPSKIFDLTPPFDWGNDVIAPTFSLGGPLGYAFSPDSKEMAFVVNSDKVPAESTNNDIYVIDVTLHDAPPLKPVTKAQGLGWAPKKVSTSPGSDDGPQYSPDGKYLAWRSQARNGYESDKFDLVVMDRATGKIKDLTEKFDGWIDEFSWLPSMSAIVFVSATQGEAPIYLLPFLPDAPVQVVRKRDDPGEFSDVHMLSDGRLVASRMGTNHPTELFATTPLVRQPDGSFGGGQGFTLTHINDSLVASLDFDQGDSFWFSGADDVKVQGFLIRPPNFDPAQKYPLKFLIHGGPQGAWGDAWSYRWNPELFAASGYVVVMINPRGSTGYGQKFLEEVSGDWGGRPYIDLMKGLDFAEAKYPFIDKTRECALGASYGGYMADWVLTHTHRFACIVTHDGMFNPQSAFGDTEELWFNEWEFRPLQTSGAPSVPAASSPGRVGSNDAVVEQTAPAHPWDFFDKPAAEDPFRKWSPMQNIKFAKTPTLVIHSQRDYRLDVSEGLQLFTALQLLHVPSKMLYFPDEGHWVLKPQNSQLWYQTVNDWVDQWTHTNAYAHSK